MFSNKNIKIITIFFFLLSMTSICEIKSKFLQSAQSKTQSQNKSPSNNTDYTKLVFDTFWLLQGESPFSSDVWDAIYTCMSDSTTPNLNEASNLGWKGMMEHGQEAKNATWDPWGSCGGWKECNKTKLPTNFIENIDQVVIVAPCNTVSNIAYYRTFLDICGQNPSMWHIPIEYVIAFKKAFVFEGIGSAYNHGSGTNTGGSMDVQAENAFSWIIHQASINSLPFDPYIFNLQPENAAMNSIQVVDAIETLLLTKSVHDWKNIIDSFYVPQIYRSIGAILASSFIVILPEPDALWVFKEIGQYLLQPIDLDILLKEYIPRLKTALDSKQVKPTLKTKIKFAERLIGTVIKLLYGVIFQEQLIESPYLIDPTVTYLGNVLMPIVDIIGNVLTGYKRYTYIYDEWQQISKDVYAGRSNCGGKKFSHPIWHEETANALVDLFYLANDFAKIVEGTEPIIPEGHDPHQEAKLEDDKFLRKMVYRSCNYALLAALYKNYQGPCENVSHQYSRKY